MDRIDDQLKPSESTCIEYIAGELSEQKRRAFETQLAADPSLKKTVEELKSTQALLKQSPPHTVGRDLASVILQGIEMKKRGKTPRAHPVKFMLRAAALLLVCAGLMFLVHTTFREAPPAAPSSSSGQIPPAEKFRTEAVTDALNWLARNQEGDGSWDPARWKGQNGSQIGLTGMGLLAFVRHNPLPAQEVNRSVVSHAVNYLLSQQSPDGGIGGPQSGASYKHDLATAALIETYMQPEYRSLLKEPIKKALAYMRRTHVPHLPGATAHRPPPPNQFIWHFHALSLAKRNGFSVAAPLFQDALAQLDRLTAASELYPSFPRSPSVSSPSALAAANALSRFSLQSPASSHRRLREKLCTTLVAALEKPGGHQELYRWYLTAEAARTGSCPQLTSWLTELQQNLVQSRNQEGISSGSWDPDARFKAVGGRLYSTILATLILQQAPKNTSC